MPYCIHHVPGRARFKVPNLRRDPSLAAEVTEKITALDGIVRVEVNRHAASVVVHYDVAANPLDKVVTHLGAPPAANGANGTIHHRASPSDPILLRPDSSRNTGTRHHVTRSVGQVFGQAMFATLVQRTLERSLLSILTGIR